MNTPHIDFYIIRETSQQGRFSFCCALIEKIYLHQRKIYVYCDEPYQASELDNILWTYKDISFIPHCLSGSQPLADSPVQIGHTPPPEIFNDILINLSLASAEIPGFYRQFERIIEIVHQDDKTKELLRLRYQNYRAQQCAIKTHQH